MSQGLTGSTVYGLLSDADRKQVRATLGTEHAHFYHATVKRHLDSIRQHGLDPRFEGEDSSYGHRQHEPYKALHYATKPFLELAFSAASTRARVWNEALGIDVSNDGEVVIVRMPADSILTRSFGLDHSFGNMRLAAEVMLASKEQLSAEEFVSLVRQFGAISCYDPIPPEELEICTDSVCSFDGSFAPLLVA